MRALLPHLTLLTLTLVACASGGEGALPPRHLEVERQLEVPSSAEPAPSPALLPAKARLGVAVQQGEDDAQLAAVVPAVMAAARAMDAAISATDARLGAVWRHDAERVEVLEVLKAWESPGGVMSVGSTSRGTLLGAAELAMDGEHHTIIARARPRNTRYGPPAMIKMLLESAADVAAHFPGAKLAMGNIAYKRGGDIRWSVSHNSGRDADIAFYVKDAATGEPLDAAPDLVTFQEDGRAMGGAPYLFDVERNWALARALLQHKDAQIQYLFISDGLKAMLLAHARAIHEPPELIAMASEALRQPTDALPHNDHFHLRLTCQLEDRLRGCVDRGPRWSWVDWHDEALRKRTLGMLPGLEHPETSVRLATLEYIKAIDSPLGANVALWLAAYNERPEVRERALSIARGFYTFDGVAVVGMQRLIRSESVEASERAQLYALMRRSLDAWTVPFVLEQLQDPSLGASEKAWAARALAHQMREELVPALLEQLPAHPPVVQLEIAQILRRIANRAEPIDWSRAAPAQRAQAYEGWARWWEHNSGMPRAHWVAQGMKAVGVEPAYAMLPTAIEPMLEALPGAPDHLMYNINRTLREITGRWASLEQRNGSKLEAYWRKWWKRHRARMLGAG